jgi:hypothetical protein
MEPPHFGAGIEPVTKSLTTTTPISMVDQIEYVHGQCFAFGEK